MRYAPPIVMPTKTAAQNNVPRDYLGHLWEGDVLELGDVSVPSGCEDHNGQVLLKKAGFTPVVVTYIPRAAAIVEGVKG